MIRIAVLGAAGFIGSRLVEVLHLAGMAHVRAVVRTPARLASAARFAVEFSVADAGDRDSLAAAFEGCDIVVHAIAGDPETIMGTIAPVYLAAEKAGCRRLVYLSTASVHGQNPPLGTTEDSPLSDRQYLPYNNAKVRAERQLLQLRREGRVEVVILRPGIVFGPRSFWTGGFADELLAGQAYLVGGGWGVCNSVYVDNLVHSVWLACSSSAGDGRAYFVGDAEEVTWRDLCRPVVEALGRSFSDVFQPAPDTVGYARQSLVERLALSAAAETLRTRLPVPLRKGAGAFLRALNEQANAGPPAISHPEITEERAQLHTAAVRLSWTRATLELGYHPPVSFTEGCRRSIEWLAFAGYPVVMRP